MLDPNPTHWFHSWTSKTRLKDGTDRVQGELDEVLRDVNSYGFSFRGFSSKVTGRIEMDQFFIMRAPSFDKATDQQHITDRTL